MSKLAEIYPEITAVNTAANERYNSFIDKAVEFQRSEKMTEEAFSEYCEITRTTWTSVKLRIGKTNGHTLFKISISTGIPL